MTPHRFRELTGRYADLRIAIVGDFSLDRYLEIDPARTERSIETGLEVFNVVRVRAQPGAAGTILNNLCALGVGAIYPVGFCGLDGEGFELRAALQAKPGVRIDHFLQTRERCTFTYCKPLLMARGRPPRELNRLDRKNWTPTPGGVQRRLVESLHAVAAEVDAVILMDQVDLAETGVVTRKVLTGVRTVSRRRPELPIIADSRRGLHPFPPVIYKMNATELRAMTGGRAKLTPATAQNQAARLAQATGRQVFVTLAEQGIVGADPDGRTVHQPAWPVRGPIDIVGAGDSVTGNLAAALAAGARLDEAITFANAAASIVIHQLGTTGTATVTQLATKLRLPHDSGSN